MRLGRAWIAAPLLLVSLLVAVAGPASATGEGEAPLVVSPDQPGSLGVVSTAQSDTEISPESDNERRLVGRESSERVDGVVIGLWSIAAGMTVMLVLFLWHTSPRRRLRLARRRSTQLYDGEADRAEDDDAAGSADDAELVDDAAAAAAAARQDEEAVAVVASGADEDPEPSGPALATAEEELTEAEPAAEDPAGSQDEDDAETEPQPVEEESGPDEPLVATARAEPDVQEPEVQELEVEEPELPPVWEDEAEPAAAEADPAGGPEKESPGAKKAVGERMSGFWMQLRRTLGLD